MSPESKAFSSWGLTAQQLFIPELVLGDFVNMKKLPSTVYKMPEGGIISHIASVLFSLNTELSGHSPNRVELPITLDASIAALSYCALYKYTLASKAEAAQVVGLTLSNVIVVSV